MHYIYDKKTGKLKSPGTKEDQPGIILMVDPFGNVTITRTERTYRLINGQAKVDIVATHTEMDNIDGSHTIAVHKDWTSQASEMKYDYDTDTGKLQNDGANELESGIVLMVDPFGNVTITRTERKYRLIKGQAKVDIITTHTEMNNIDDSHTIAVHKGWSSQASVMKYDYDADTGKLRNDGANELESGIMLMDDGFGNITRTETKRTYTRIKGQARIDTVTTSTEIENIDGSRTIANHEGWSSQASKMKYDYDTDTGKLQKNGANELESGIMLMNDGFGNVTRTETERTYTLIKGQAKVDTVTTHTEIKNIDDSHTIASYEDKGWTSQASIMHYIYDEGTGLLTGDGAEEDQHGIMLMNDGFGNVTKTVTERTYRLIKGQAKVDTVTTTTEIDNIDGSYTIASYEHKGWNSQASKIKYDYDTDTGKLQNHGADELTHGIMLMDDGFGNVTRTETRRTYRLIKGQAKIDGRI